MFFLVARSWLIIQRPLLGGDPAGISGIGLEPPSLHLSSPAHNPPSVRLTRSRSAREHRIAKSTGKLTLQPPKSLTANQHLAESSSSLLPAAKRQAYLESDLEILAIKNDGESGKIVMLRCKSTGAELSRSTKQVAKDYSKLLCIIAQAYENRSNRYAVPVFRHTLAVSLYGDMERCLDDVTRLLIRKLMCHPHAKGTRFKGCVWHIRINAL